MFRICRVVDTRVRMDELRVAQVLAILRAQMPDVPEKRVAAIPDQLANPIKYRFRFVLFVAENGRHQVKGFALMSHDPELDFCYLDYISTASRRTGGGIGGALYERVRQEAHHLGAVGLFFECLPDDPALCQEPEELPQNRARLRFYERFGARPIANTAYETPLGPDSGSPPYLMLDPLGREATVKRAHAKKIFRAVLDRKYPGLCPPEYTEMVIDSIREPELRLREPRYGVEEKVDVVEGVPPDRRVAVVVNDRHDIHHVRERGYVESPARVRRIAEVLARTGFCETIRPRRFPDKHILAVHDRDYLTYFKRVCAGMPDDKSVYPYVFPIRNADRRPSDLATRAGYYCIDTFTPLSGNAYKAARRAVDCTLTAASEILEGRRIAYALVRPPGHHAERRSFGGFCYFNNAAIAAELFRREGRVAILDVDYHHGNGQQEIFYRRRGVLTISLHGHPSFAYPYFTGFKEERGAGTGKGFNLNLPLPEEVDGARYSKALGVALDRVREFAPSFLVVALGLDPAKGDPTGTWSLTGADFERNGFEIGRLSLPTLVVQEGGYRIRNLGTNAMRFFKGVTKGAFAPPAGT